MAEIRCPMCGKPNPAELDVCQFCEARLKPLTDALSRSQPPIHPGEEPTEKDTSDLEPVLPQWLREVRQQARDSAEEEPEQVPAEEEAAPSDGSDDLLAGLQSEGESSEKIPDWLADLRGEGSQSAPGETSSEEDDLAALKSMFGEEPSSNEESEASALPGWISGLDASETEEEADEEEPSTFLLEGETEEQAQAGTAASSTDFAWGADFEVDTNLQADSTQDEGPIDTELPAWLQSSDEEPKGEVEGGLPAWMRTEEPAQATPPQEGEEPAEQVSTESDTPDWLASLGEETTEITPQEAAQPALESDMPDWSASLGEESAESPPPEEAQPAPEGDMPDWLSSLDAESAETSPQEEEAQPTAAGDMPDWLSSLGAESAEVVPQPEEAQPTAEGDMPDWLSSSGDESPETSSQAEIAQPAVEGDMPDWLSSLGDESTSQTSDVVDETQQPAVEGDTPDWLSSMGEGTTELEGAFEATETPDFTTEEASHEPDVQSLPADEEKESLSTPDVDALFAMEMPDWLSSTSSREEEEAPAAPTEPQEGDLSLADLPSWVQAMRPVEAVISDTSEGSATDQYVEETGPLAGLRGVLPAVSGVGPSSIPKAYSIKLRASEDQQSGAAMLEQMLATEVKPKPITTQPIVLPQRFLRWVISIVLLLVVGGSVFTGTQINPLPTGAPPETSAALRYIQNNLPADAPVLLVFDYQAALAGELEAAAAPMVDQMLTLKHPRLSLISSTPTGSGLAESLMKILQADHDYQRGQNFVNLGYLPGGAAGVLGFAENPGTTKPLSINGENAWETPVLQGVNRISDFAAIILLTDDVDTARIWIEQTESTRGETIFLVVSSAQSGPMILPYVQSGQVNGMVTGLDGSAPIERINSGRPGMVRRYWDAYGFGLLAALAMIAFGSLWSLVSGWRERRREQGEA